MRAHPGRCFRTWVLPPTNSSICPSFSPVFRPNECPPSFNFQKARSDDFVSYFHCSSAEEYSSLSLFSAAALFTSLALNAAKSFISFGRIKRHSKAWWSAEVKDAVSIIKDARLSLPLTEVMKTARFISPFLDVFRLSLPRLRLRHGIRLAVLFRPNLTQNLYTVNPRLSRGIRSKNNPR